MANPEIVEIYYFRASAKRPFRPTLVGKNLLYVEIMTGEPSFTKGGSISGERCSATRAETRPSMIFRRRIPAGC